MEVEEVVAVADLVAAVEAVVVDLVVAVVEILVLLQQALSNQFLRV